MLASEIPFDYTLVIDQTIPLTSNNAPNHWGAIPLTIHSLRLPIIIDVQVIQLPGRVDDVEFFLLDEQNYAIYQQRKNALASDQTAVQNRFGFVRKGRIVQGQLFFLTNHMGTLYLVLDNSHSAFKEKTVIVKIYKQLPVTASYEAIKKDLSIRQWHEAARHLENASLELTEGRLENCYNSLRVAFGTILLEIVESLTNTKIMAQKGKSFPITELMMQLEAHGVPNEISGILKRHWSLVSEGLHAEKNRGHPPTEQNVRFAFTLILDSIHYMLSMAGTHPTH